MTTTPTPTAPACADCQAPTEGTGPLCPPCGESHAREPVCRRCGGSGTVLSKGKRWGGCLEWLEQLCPACGGTGQ